MWALYNSCLGKGTSRTLGKDGRSSCFGKLGKGQFLALEKAMGCGRGGPRHFAKPLVDADVLFSILSSNEGLASDIGSYEHVSKTYDIRT